MIFYPESAVERAMKVQDVMLQAMAKKITWWQAAEILGISDRHLRRWREPMRSSGSAGCSTAGEDGPLPSVCRWRWWSGCWGCTGSAISI